MPEIKCEHGHITYVSTTQWIDKLNLDQLRHAHTRIGEKITSAEAGPKRTVWLVSDGLVNEAWYREEEFEKAADHLLRIFKKKFMDEAPLYNAKPFSPYQFTQIVPSITPTRVTQFEYDIEWFPAKA